MRPRSKDRAHLRQLLGREPSRFLDRVWCQRHAVFHGPLGRFPALDALPELSDVSALLRSLPSDDSRVRLWFAPEGQLDAVSARPADAERLYRLGQLTVVVNTIDAHLRSVRELVAGVARDLGTPQVAFGCNAYASPPHFGTGMHFDHQEVFLLQLRGTKRWEVAANEQVRHPSGPYYGEGHPLPRELERLRATFPRKMPRHRKIVVLRPGSVLYLPRGTWHASRAGAAGSLALTLTYQSSSFADVTLNALRARLLSDEAWRAPAAGLSDSGSRGVRARRLLARLLAGLDGGGVVDLSDCLAEVE